MKSTRNHRKTGGRKGSFMDWVEHYKRYIAVGGILVCLIVVAAVIFLGKIDKKSARADSALAETEVPDVLEEVPEEVEIPNDLLLDAYPEITALMENYYNSMAAGDVEAVRGLVDVLSEDAESYIEALKTLIEGYQNIHCYTKRGLQENEYLVFVRYDLKFIAVESVAPGVEGYYVCEDETGAPYIFRDVPSEELTAYINELIQHEDVQVLYDEVWEAFAAAEAADEKLAEYGMKLKQLKDGEVTESEEAVAEEDGEVSEETEEGETVEETEDAEESETATGEASVVNKKTRFKESVNVRKDRTTESERIALAYQGEEVTHVESYEDGWSKIVYNGKEGYCKTEFLE